MKLLEAQRLLQSMARDGARREDGLHDRRPRKALLRAAVGTATQRDARSPGRPGDPSQADEGRLRVCRCRRRCGSPQHRLRSASRAHERRVLRDCALSMGIHLADLSTPAHRRHDGQGRDDPLAVGDRRAHPYLRRARRAPRAYGSPRGAAAAHGRRDVSPLRDKGTPQSTRPR